MADKAATEFRRASLTINHVETIEAEKVEGILGLLRQPFDQKKLKARIDELKDSSGRLDFPNYTKIMSEFVTCPIATEKMAGDEFAFKHLINRNDFSNP